MTCLPIRVLVGVEHDVYGVHVVNASQKPRTQLGIIVIRQALAKLQIRFSKLLKQTERTAICCAHMMSRWL